MTTPDPVRPYRVSYAPGLAPWLQTEIEQLGLPIESTDHTGVATRGTMIDGMRMLLHLRTAYHVLQRFADIKATSSDMLHAETTRLPWERVIPVDGYLGDLIGQHAQRQQLDVPQRPGQGCHRGSDPIGPRPSAQLGPQGGSNDRASVLEE